MLFILYIVTIATLDRVNVEVEGQSYSLKQVAQIGMPNPSMMVINLASYPQVCKSTPVSVMFKVRIYAR